MGVAAAAFLLSVATVDAQTQSPPPAKADDKGGSSPAGPPPPAAERPAIPNATQLAMMIQTYVSALSQANVTANYTVLHAFGAPAFQQGNPPEKLAEIFAHMRAQGLDLTPVILYAPILVREPAYDEQGLLRLVGYYKTEPQQVHFDVTLQPVEGVWRLFGISVKTVPSPAVGVAAPAPAAPTPQAKDAAKKETPKKDAPKKEAKKDAPRKETPAPGVAKEGAAQ